jgi:selenocysteine-specific elongation factor
MASRFLILGTAGHIDHGKTALVGLLTGTDTDRLKEEKTRGISIDLGFAHLDLPGGVSCGVVDVPGHERFVKNMLAGACGVDAMLLVVAADEGIMPQTREHLDILDLLGVTRGVVALTKTDMVEPDWLELVTESVSEYLDERGFGDFPVVPVSSKTGEGKDAVLRALAEAVAGIEDRSDAGSVRLPVDRAFTVEGFGTVVTGTLWRGAIAGGDRLVIEPGGVEARVRKVEVHGHEVASAHAGQRTAVSLAGVAKDRVPRGSWLLTPGTLAPSHMLDVRIRVLRDASKELRHRQRIRFHLGASEILGRVALLEGETLAPGKDALAQIRLEAPAVADRGDRFVLRSYSPARAVAGGRILVPAARKHRRGRPEILDALHREESGSVDDRVAAALDAAGKPLSETALAKALGIPGTEAQAALAALAEAGRAVPVDESNFLSNKTLQDLGARAEATLDAFQKDHPIRWGMGRGELKSSLGTGITAPVFDAVIRELIAAGRVSQRGDHFRRGDPEHALPPQLRSQVDAVARELARDQANPPSPKELEERTGARVHEVLEHLTFEGQAVKVTPDLYLSSLHLQKLQEWLRNFFETNDRLTVAELKAAFGLSRKFSVPILEYLDREGWTRRQGDFRVRGRRLDG